MNHCTSFGEWIQLRCQVLNLQPKQLADQVGYSLASIRKIGRDEWRPRGGAERLAEVLCLNADERTLFLQVAAGNRPATELPPPNLRGFTMASTASRKIEPDMEVMLDIQKRYVLLTAGS